MLEVPTYKHIHSRGSGYSNMLCIGSHFWGDHALRNVRFGQIHCFSVELQRHDMRRGHTRKMLAHLFRRRVQLSQGQRRYDHDEVPLDKAVHEANGMFGEFFVLTAADYRSIHIDPKLHSRSIHFLQSLRIKAANNQHNAPPSRHAQGA